MKDMNEYNRRYYAEHKAEISEKRKGKRRERTEEERRIVLERAKKWAEEHPDRKREHGRAYYRRHRDEILAKRREQRRERNERSGNNASL